MALKVGELFAQLTIDREQFDKGLDGAEGRMSAVGGAIKGAVAGAAASAGAALVGAVAGADRLQQALNGLQAQTGATDGEMKGMESSLRNIYANNYGESFQDIADSMAQVKQATGAAGPALEGLTTQALKLRDTFGYEVTESAATAQTMMKKFGISGEQAMTLIAQGTQKGLDKQGDMLDTFNEYSVYFSEMGMSAEDMFNTLAAGAENGAFNLDKVGDAVKEFGIRGKENSKEMADSFQALGLNGAEMFNSIAEGGTKGKEAFQKTMTALSQIEDPLKRNELGIQLMGTQFEDLEDTTIASFANIKQSADMNANTLQQIGNIKYDSLTEAFAGIGRQLVNGLFIPLGQKVLPKLNELATWVQANMPTIQSVMQVALSAVGAAFDGFAAGISFVISNIDIIVPALTAMAAVFTAKVVPAMAMAKVAAIKSAAATALAYLPLTLTIAAVGAAVAGLALIWRKWGDDIKRITSATVDAVVSWFKNFWNTTKSVFSTMRDGLTSIWQTVKSTTVNIVSSLVDSIVGRFQNAKDNLSGIISTVKNFFVQTWENLKLAVLSIVGAFLSILTGDFEGFKLSIRGLLTAIKNQFSNIWSTIKNLVIEYVTLLANGAKNLISNMKNGFMNILSSLKNGAANIWSGIKSTAVNMMENLRSGVGEKMQAAKQKIVDIWNAAKDFLANIDLLSIGKNIIQGLINGIGSMASAVRDKVRDIADGIKNKIQSALSIKSPSRWAMWAGQMFGEGLVKGQDKSISRVGKAAGRLAGAAMDGVKNMTAKVNPMGVGGGGGYAGTKAGDIVTHVTIHSPTPHKPSEEKRKYEQTQRRLAREWGLA